MASSIEFHLSTPEAAAVAAANSGLSYRARGVLSYLLTRPEGLRVSAEWLAAHSTEGQKAVRTALRELTEAGFIRRERYRDLVKGRWSYRVVISDRPGA